MTVREGAPLGSHSGEGATPLHTPHAMSCAPPREFGEPPHARWFLCDFCVSGLMIPLGNMGCPTAQLVGNPTPPLHCWEPECREIGGVGGWGVRDQKSESINREFALPGRKIFSREGNPQPLWVCGEGWGLLATPRNLCKSRSVTQPPPHCWRGLRVFKTQLCCLMGSSALRGDWALMCWPYSLHRAIWSRTQIKMDYEGADHSRCHAAWSRAYIMMDYEGADHARMVRKFFKISWNSTRP